MQLVTERVRASTRGNDDDVDLTSQVQALVDRHRLRHGQVLAFVSGSTPA